MIPLLCTTLAAPGCGELIQRAGESLDAGADVVEIRLDHLQDLDDQRLQRLRQEIGERALVTCRPRRQGGLFDGPEPDRIAWLARAARLGFWGLDVEIDTEPSLRDPLLQTVRGSGVRLVLSHHHLHGSPNPGEILRWIEESDAWEGIAKVVAPTRSLPELVALFEAARAARTRGWSYALCGTGLLGSATRFLSPEMGNALTYACQHSASPLVEGQVGMGELLTSWKNLRGTRLPRERLALIGGDVSRSLSPRLFQAAFERLGLPWTYLSLSVPAGTDLVGVVEGLRALEFRGWNVTSPHKVAFLSLLDEVSDDARRAGAVNTVVNDRGRLRGFNTDIHGVRTVLTERVGALRERRALVLGAGGAARGAVCALLGEGARVEVCNRTSSRARELSAQFKNEVGIVPWADLETAYARAEIVVQATSVGWEDRAARPARSSGTAARLGRLRFSPDQVVLDLVYGAWETPLLAAAERAGATRIHGIEVLLHQADRAFSIWSGHRLPLAYLRQVLESRIDPGIHGDRSCPVGRGLKTEE